MYTIVDSDVKHRTVFTICQKQLKMSATLANLALRQDVIKCCNCNYLMTLRYWYEWFFCRNIIMHHNCLPVPPALPCNHECSLYLHSPSKCSPYLCSHLSYDELFIVDIVPTDMPMGFLFGYYWWYCCWQCLCHHLWRSLHCCSQCSCCKHLYQDQQKSHLQWFPCSLLIST